MHPVYEVHPIYGPPGEKLLNLVEDNSRYLLAFLGSNYLSKSQSYVFMKFTFCRRVDSILKLATNPQCCELPPMCAARGKTLLNLAFHTIWYHLPKFHQIIFQIDQTTVIWSSPPIFSPNSPCHFDQNRSTGGFTQILTVPKMNASGKIRY